MSSSENWLPIPGYPDYEVSDHGRVWSKISNCLLTVSMRDGGYYYATLGRAGRNKLIHRLVATAFITPDIEGLEVNHDDGDKSNNHVSNLIVCTPVENVMHAYETGLHPSNSKFTPKRLRVIETDEVFASISSLARVLGVSPQAVHLAASNPNATVKGLHVERVLV